MLCTSQSLSRLVVLPQCFIFIICIPTDRLLFFGLFFILWYRKIFSHLCNGVTRLSGVIILEAIITHSINTCASKSLLGGVQGSVIRELK